MRYFPLLLLIGSCVLSATEPLISSLLPRGGQRGTQQEVVISGNRLQDAQEIFFYDDEIVAGDLKMESGKKITTTFSISPNAKFGQHEMRVRTLQGISKLATFWVGPFPNDPEKEPNSSFEEAQEIQLNSTINGVALNEDVDYYEINATKGQRISAEVEAIRLSGPLFDPYLAILDENFFEIASSDDSELLLQDSTTSIIAPKTGKYFIEMRESSYRGSNSYRYRLHVGSFPRPRVVVPSGGQAGKSVEFTFLGDPKGPFKKTITLPDDGSDILAYHPEENGLFAPSPNNIKISNFPSIQEVEPNNGIKEATKTHLSIPLGFNGVIDKEGDFDYFRFQAKKGDRYYIKAHARSVASPLDPVLNLYHGDGKSIRGNDDGGNGPDSLITQTFPKDGEYVLRITDHLSRGSPLHAYRIETQKIGPEISASIPMFSNRDSQSRQMIPVPRGNRAATSFTLSRKNFTGDLDILAKNLPKGVKISVPKAPSSFNSIPILFSAEANAPLKKSLAEFEIIHFDKDKNTNISGKYKHRVDLVYGPPNNRTYYEATYPFLPIAVVEPVPFKVKLHPPPTPIVRGGSLNLKVEVIRDANFSKEIVVKILAKPPGIGAKGNIKIPSGKNFGYYSLTANGGTPIGEWEIGVQGEAAASGGGQILAASNFIKLKTEEPYLSVKINMSAIQRGQQGEMVCDLDIMRPFEGIAKAELKGLPPFSSTEQIDFDANSSQIRFPITTEDKARAGLTKNLFCFVRIPFSGELITHSVGQGGQIRLDNPPPKPKSQIEKPKKTTAKPVVKKEKPLSRLEQLRLAAQSTAN
ncbi:MAG: PPC domain-containing protein [Verrucomicrobiota bacterium]|nr:PPC domain-containing protein [Verrucomicrobiota bacterium]